MGGGGGILVTFLRSSSVGADEFCQTQAAIQYTLGLEPNEENGWDVPPSQFKANQGGQVHKALELLACRKLAEQEGRAGFRDDELGRDFGPGLSVEDAFEASWRYHVESFPRWDWSRKVRADCRGWTDDALTLSGGAFNPLNREVVWPEKRFDIVLDEFDWARYSYELPGWPRLEGHLSIKGTIDLVCRMPGQDGVLEMVDWKTGRRFNWSTGEVKDWRKLRDDFQLRFYHYALARMAPWAKEIIVSIIFIKDGGAYSMPFSRADLRATEAIIREKFEAIRDRRMPEAVWDRPSERWRCEKLCPYGRSAWEGGGKTVCQHLRGEMLTLGTDMVTAKYGSPRRLMSYGAGGGRSAE